MDRKPVTSSSIKSVGHDPESQVMEIEFTNGAVHQYQGVSEEDYETLMKAHSIGGHFHAHIRNNYTSRKV